MKILFFGTPAYVVPILEGLHKAYNRGKTERELIGVLTQSPKPSGREHHVEFSAVDTFAHAHKIDIYFDANKLPEADLAICAAYGKIIPQNVIEKFPLGILNIHPSLLPQFRGASPIQSTILEGVQTTGVTIIKMDADLDHGPIVSSFKSVVTETDTNETLRDRLFQESVDFLLELIPHYISGKINLKEQDHSKATYTKPTLKEDGYIPGEFLAMALEGKTSESEWNIRFIKDFTISPTIESIERYIRSLAPWPGTFTFVTINNEKKRLKILSAHVSDEQLVLDEVQLEGKNPVSFEQFKTGYPSFTFSS